MAENYYIFGAHSRGQTLYEYLRKTDPKSICLGFMYDNDEHNPSDVDGVPVYKITGGMLELEKTAVVYMGIRGDGFEHVSLLLKKIGFDRVVPVSPAIDTELRNKYVRIRFEDAGKVFIKISDFSSQISDMSSVDEIKQSHQINGKENSAIIYIAKILNDTQFTNPVTLHDHERIIQVGCALADNRDVSAIVFDNVGENISDKNRQFCELTGLYWLWKHAENDIIGLEHWRRRFILPDGWDDIMKEQNIDVVLSVPLYLMPSLEGNFKTRHMPEIWDAMIDVMSEVHPDEVETVKEYFCENDLFTPCNMFIAKKDVICVYCEWMFPVVFKLHERIGEVDDKYQNRYPGFVAERLLSYYFDIRRDRYKVAYADKTFLR